VRDAGRNLRLLEQAAAEFLEEGFQYPLLKKILDDTAPEHHEQAKSKMLAPRTVPEGYFVWLGYLIWIERVLELVPTIELTAVEVESLLVLRRARNKFQAEHPPCPRCGMPNEQHALRCRECMKEINR